MYEESFKMPFLISCPDQIAPNSVSDELVMNIDFAPTLLDFAGLPVPDEMQGKSFKNALVENQSSSRDAVYYHYYEYPIWHKVQPHYGIKSGPYKLMHFYYSMDEWELYNLDDDPYELSNMYASAPDSLVQRLKSELKALQVEFGDDQPLEDMKLMTDTVIQRVYSEPRKALERKEGVK